MLAGPAEHAGNDLFGSVIATHGVDRDPGSDALKALIGDEGLDVHRLAAPYRHNEIVFARPEGQEAASCGFLALMRMASRPPYQPQLGHAWCACLVWWQ